MKTRNKVLLVTLVLMLFCTTVSALVYHINDAAEALKHDYQDRVNTYYAEKDFKIKNDVSDFTQKEIQRMKSETEDYLNQRLGQDYQDSLNEKSKEIRNVTDEKIEELKEYIDELLSTP